MEMHPFFQHVMALIPVFRHFIQMKDYGAPTQKGTWLYCSDPWISDIALFKAKAGPSAEHGKEMVVHYVDSKGIKRIAGGRDLKGSQAYPKGFGTAVCRLQAKPYETLNRFSCLKDLLGLICLFSFQM